MLTCVGRGCLFYVIYAGRYTFKIYYIIRLHHIIIINNNVGTVHYCDYGFAKNIYYFTMFSTQNNNIGRYDKSLYYCVSF